MYFFSLKWLQTNYIESIKVGVKPSPNRGSKTVFYFKAQSPSISYRRTVFNIIRVCILIHLDHLPVFLIFTIHFNLFSQIFNDIHFYPFNYAFNSTTEYVAFFNLVCCQFTLWHLRQLLYNFLANRFVHLFSVLISTIILKCFTLNIGNSSYAIVHSPVIGNWINL